MTDQAQAAFNAAKELASQLISLSIGVITASIAFMKDIIASAPRSGIRALRYAWIFYLSSIVCGIWTMMAITGSLSGTAVAITPFSSNIKIPASFQIVLFMFATLCMLIFASKAMISKE